MAAHSTLWDANPWWTDKARINEDRQIAKWKESDMRYDPSLRARIRYEYESGNSVIYTLRGARQVGKTTLIKLQIREFLESVNPWNLFYYAFDMIDSRSEMAEIIQEYVFVSRGKRQGRAYLFLDEITSVSEWQKGIKWLVDAAKLPDCTVLATGSRAQSILRASERLPGRRGRTEDPYDRVLAPMRFSEFACASDPAIAGFFKECGLESAGKRHGALREALSGSVPAIMDKMHGALGPDLQRHLESYMLSGGIPRVVDEMAKTGRIGRGTYTAYRDGIAGDWGPRSDETLRQLGRAIADSMGSAVYWDGLRRQADLGGWESTRSGVLSLKDLSVVAVIYKYGDRKKVPRLSGHRKIYFQDPFYMHLFGLRADHPEPFARSEAAAADPAWAGRLAEGIVADHLIRLAADTARNPQDFAYTDHVFFWSDAKGREVDFVFYKRGELEAPVEVKYRNRIDHRELGGIAGFAGSGSGTVLSKGEFGQRRDYSVVPAAEFLALV